MGNKYPQGRMASINADVDFWVDDYLEYATNKALTEEMVKRTLFGQITDVTNEELINAVCGRLNILDSHSVRDYLEKVLRDT